MHPCSWPSSFSFLFLLVLYGFVQRCGFVVRLESSHWAPPFVAPQTCIQPQNEQRSGGTSPVIQLSKAIGNNSHASAGNAWECTEAVHISDSNADLFSSFLPAEQVPSNRSAFVFLSVRPSAGTVNFASQLATMDQQNIHVYYVIDDERYFVNEHHRMAMSKAEHHDGQFILHTKQRNSAASSSKSESRNGNAWQSYSLGTGVRFIKPSRSLSVSLGYQHSSLNDKVHFGLRFTSWDRALYYFSEVTLHSYEKVFFIEDDVLIPSPASALALLRDTAEFDLISSPIRSRNDDPDWEHWPLISDFPSLTIHSNSIVAAVGVSRSLLSAIKEFARANGELVYLELLFPSVAQQTALRISTPAALATVTYRQPYSIDGEWHFDSVVRMGEWHWYHPCKDSRIRSRVQDYFQLPHTARQREDWLRELQKQALA